MTRIVPAVLLCLMVLLIAVDLPAAGGRSGRRKSSGKHPVVTMSPDPAVLPRELSDAGGDRLMLGSVADTFLLGEWDFDDGTAQGWTTEDRTAQQDTFFHIADASELGGGDYGNLLPLEGAQSLWCGKAPAAESPYCDWENLPGYGHLWDQRFESQSFTGDTIEISYRIRWYIEQSYDLAYCQYLDGGDWENLPVDGGMGVYGLLGSWGDAVESFRVVPQGGTTRFRFRFVSDGDWDDEDGLWITDGALLVDSITVTEISYIESGMLTIVGFPAGWTGTGERIAVSGSHLFVTKGTGGVQSVDISDPENPVLRGNYDTPGTAFGIVVDGSYAYVADGTTLQVLDISDPDNPSYEGSVALFYGGGFDGRGVAVSGGIAYVAHYYGIDVIDVSTPSTPLFIRLVSIAGARDITIDGSFAYVTGGSNGLDVLYLGNPSYPTIAGSLPFWVGTSYSAAVGGGYAYLACGTQGIAIIDISNPYAPSLVDGHDTAGETYYMEIRGDSAFVADGSEGLLIVDISDPLSAADSASCATPSTATGLVSAGLYTYVVTQSHGPQTVIFGAGSVREEYFEDFEGEDPGALETDEGLWYASVAPGFGDYAALQQGSSVLQEDPCNRNDTYLWGFFDDPGSTDYSCGGHPEQGAMPFGPDGMGYYLDNILISPEIELTGPGSSIKLRFSVYRDLPLSNLQSYYCMVRSRSAVGCMGRWEHNGFFYYGDDTDWHTADLEIGNMIDPGSVSIQVAVGAFDLCPLYDITPSCHSHAPLIDDIRVLRISGNGPSFVLWDTHLFQDNFPDDGTVTGTARADMAMDLCGPGNVFIIPGDSIVISVSDPDVGVGVESAGPSAGRAAVRAYVRRHGHEGDCLEIMAPEIRPAVGNRYECIGIEGDYCVFSMDTVFTDESFTSPVPGLFCFDLDDYVLVPGDSVSYFFGAMNSVGQWTYCSRTMGGQGPAFVTDDMAEAKSSPMEFCILPAPGRDILYVDGSDDRGGPAQAYFDAALERIGISGRVDRFDVLGPSSCAGNSLASRVLHIYAQLEQYDVIIWSGGGLENGVIGDYPDGPEKSPDYDLLYEFLNRAKPSGLYLTGDNIAEEWAGLATAGPAALRSRFMNFDLESGDHVSLGEPVSPRLRACGDVFGSPLPPDSISAFGGCPDMNRFDVLDETGGSTAEMINPSSAKRYVLGQRTTNDADSTAGVILSGFSFHELRDDNEQNSGLKRARHMLNIMEWLLGEDLYVTDSGGQVPGFTNYLSQNFPNPFNPVTTVIFGIEKKGPVKLRIFDVSGRLVRTLISATMEPGNHRAAWDGRSGSGRDVASGVYFARIETPGFTRARKLVLLR